LKASVKLYKNDGEKARGYPVKLIVTHQGKVKRSTIGYSDLLNWDELKQLPKVTHPDYEYLFGKIYDIRSKSITSKLLNETDVLRAQAYLLDKKYIPDTAPLLVDFFDKEIEYLKKVGRFGSATKYKAIRDIFNDFNSTVRLNEINGPFLEDFKRYKLQFCTKSTVKGYLSTLRALYNKAILDPAFVLEDKNPFKYVMPSLKTRRYRKRPCYLKPETLIYLEESLNNVILPEAEERSLKLSLLCFYFGGSALIDVYYLQKKQFYDDRVLFSRSKLGESGYEFDLKVFTKAQKIIDSFAPGENGYLFNFKKDYSSYISFRNNQNRSLRSLQKRLGVKLYPINKNLTTYSFRYTFANLAKKLFIDPDIIRELMGHERGDIDVVYKDQFSQEVRDEAHAKIISALI